MAQQFKNAEPKIFGLGISSRTANTYGVQESNALLLVGHAGKVTELISESRHGCACGR
jgi:hypothetical protein